MKYVNTEKVRTSINALEKMGDSQMFRMASTDGCSEELLVTAGIWTEGKALLTACVDSLEQLNEMATLMTRMADRLERLETRMYKLTSTVNKRDEAK